MKPHCKDDAKELSEFAAAWSGGDGTALLLEVEAFAKTLNVRREPEKGQLSLLAKAQVRRAPRWPIACLKTLLQAPDLFCKRKGEAYMFTSIDIKYMETRDMP